VGESTDVVQKDVDARLMVWLRSLSHPGFHGDLEARMMSWRKEILRGSCPDRRNTLMS
jgi:hypothetical protein